MGAQDVSHPCMPDVLIMQSCSWRLVVPCEGEDLCTPDPTTTPSMSPTGTPTATPSSTPTTIPSGTPTKDPTMHPTPVPTVYPTPVPTVYPTPGPTVYPTPVPTVYPTPVPTVYPTMPPTTMHPTAVPTPYPTTKAPFAEAVTMPPTDELMCRDYGPNPCPDDILLLKHDGVTELPEGSFRIISQDTSSVTVRFNQMYDTYIPFLFYQYKPDNFNEKCYEEMSVPKCQTIEMTINCMMTSPIALLEVWVADPYDVDITLSEEKKKLLHAGDDAVIPECCYPGVANDRYVTKYLLEFKCESACPNGAIV